VKLKHFILNLNKLLDDYPEAAEYEVVTSIDDEGNGYNDIWSDPEVGIYDTRDKEFLSKKKISELGRLDSEINSVCVN
jgi:hypothetical protein